MAKCAYLFFRAGCLSRLITMTVYDMHVKPVWQTPYFPNNLVVCVRKKGYLWSVSFSPINSFDCNRSKRHHHGGFEVRDTMQAIGKLKKYLFFNSLTPDIWNNTNLYFLLKLKQEPQISHVYENGYFVEVVNTVNHDVPWWNLYGNLLWTVANRCNCNWYSIE